MCQGSLTGFPPNPLGNWGGISGQSLIGGGPIFYGDGGLPGGAVTHHWASVQFVRVYMWSLPFSPVSYDCRPANVVGFVAMRFGVGRGVG